MKHKALITVILLAVLILSLASCKRLTITEYSIDSSSCNGCGECLRGCPAEAIYLGTDGKAHIDQSKCTRCGDCVVLCPQSAIY